MYLMYADESGNTGTDYDNKEQPIFVLAGILVEDKKWHDINNCFNAKKIDNVPQSTLQQVIKLGICFFIHTKL